MSDKAIQPKEKKKTGKEQATCRQPIDPDPAEIDRQKKDPQNHENKPGN